MHEEQTRKLEFPLDFAFVHQRVRDRTDDAHVDSAAEAKILIL